LLGILCDVVLFAKIRTALDYLLENGLNRVISKLFAQLQKLVDVEVLFSVVNFFLIHVLYEVEIRAIL
jgi:acetolactate synthase regulatory subunit